MVEMVTRRGVTLPKGSPSSDARMSDRLQAAAARQAVRVEAVKCFQAIRRNPAAAADFSPEARALVHLLPGFHRLSPEAQAAVPAPGDVVSEEAGEGTGEG